MDNYKITFQTWDKVADQYQEKFMYLDLYNDTYDLFCKLVEKPNAKILEIGCGPGNVTKYVLAKRPDLIIDAIDMAPNMLKLAKENNPGVDFKLMDCREIDSLTEKFDAILCGFCLPYLSKEDCLKFINDSANLLNPNGIIYFSAIEDDYSRSDFETSSNGEHKMFIYYHQEDYLLEALKKNNFEMTDLIRKHYPKAGETAATHMIILARKK